MSVCLSVCLKLRILVTTKPIGFYSSGNVLTGPVVVLGFFFWWGEADSVGKRKINLISSKFRHMYYMMKSYVTKNKQKSLY